MGDFELKLGNAVDVLKSMPDESINCCVTSPPYYALRDYGTGHWVGGDSECPHYRTSKRSDNTQTGHKKMVDSGSPVGDAIYKQYCPLCGAIRVDDQIGLEQTPEEYIQRLIDVFHEVKRVLTKDGTLWVNIGDSYWGSGSRGFDFTDVFTEKSEVQKGSKGTINLTSLPKLVGNAGDYKNKDLIGIPWMLAFALRTDGWYLRQDIIWAKTNCMPESVHDRCTKSHEYIFLLTKEPKYFFNANAIKTPVSESSINRAKYGWDCDTPCSGGVHTDKMGNRFVPESGSNKRDVWFVPTSGGYSDFDGAHYATYNPKLIEPCILAGCPEGGTPVARKMDDGMTAECLRICTDGTFNACTKLYGACARVAKDMGYRKIITYTLQSEPGTSLKASGWVNVGEAGGGNWSVPSRPRELIQESLFGTVQKYPTERKQRWEKVFK